MGCLDLPKLHWSVPPEIFLGHASPNGRYEGLCCSAVLSRHCYATTSPCQDAVHGLLRIVQS